MKKKREQTEASIKRVVYCGPTIRGVAKEDTVFIDGIPAALQEMVDRCPAMRHLLVPTSAIAQTRTELRDASSTVSIFYSKAAKFIKEERR